MTEICKNCWYWNKLSKSIDDRIDGICNRFPRGALKSGHSWCGEWKASEDER